MEYYTSVVFVRTSQRSVCHALGPIFSRTAQALGQQTPKESQESRGRDEALLYFFSAVTTAFAIVITSLISLFQGSIFIITGLRLERRLVHSADSVYVIQLVPDLRSGGTYWNTGA